MACTLPGWQQCEDLIGSNEVLFFLRENLSLSVATFSEIPIQFDSTNDKVTLAVSVQAMHLP
jgi:hypothetical protein